MPRTPTYPRAASTAETLPRSTAASASTAQPLSADGMAEKIVKYVPAEVLAFYAPAYALIPEGDLLLRRIVLGAGLIGTVVYLLAARPKSAGPPAYFYVLAAIAFLAWAVGVSDVGVQLLGLSPAASKVLFAVGVFLIPGIDEALTRFLPQPLVASG